MDLRQLKKHLGILTMYDFEELGFIDSDDESTVDGLRMRVTTDQHNKQYNEIMWASSINNGNGKFALLIHATPLDKETAKAAGKQADVARIFVNQEKAAMLLDTIRHAYPELIEDLGKTPVGSSYANQEDLLSDDEADDDEDDDLLDEEDTCDECGEPLEEICDDICDDCGEPLSNHSQAPEETSEILNKIEELTAVPNLEEPTLKEAPSVLDVDQIIDAHLLIKEELQRVSKSEADIKHLKISEPYNYMYVMSPRKNEVLLTFDELDIVHQMKTAVNEPQLLKEDAAKLLLNTIYSAYPHLKPTVKEIS